MHKQQAELSFKDSTFITAVPRKPSRVQRRATSSIKVQCLECSRVFFTRTSIPSCPGCNGSDIDLA